MKKTILFILALAAILTFALPVQVTAAKHATWYVPGNFDTIQAAIDSD